MARELENESVKASTPSKPNMIYEEVLDQADGTHSEWVEGEVIGMSPASDRHQDLVDFLTPLFRFFTETKRLGIIRPASFQMKTGKKLGGREPDIIFLSNANLDRLKPNHLDGPADLAVEIISPESRARDRGDKFYEYQQGISEYWLIDYLGKQAELYPLVEDDIYPAMSADEDGLYRSQATEGLWIEVERLWQEPLPLLRSVLKEWKLI